MDLVILPHHNTLTSIQKLQAIVRSPDISGFHEGSLFLPSYPVACVIAHTDDSPEGQESSLTCGFQTDISGKAVKKQMAVLKDLLKDADGPCRFPGILSDTSCPTKLILPVEVPFLQAVQTAGFTPVEAPHFVLGTWSGQPDAIDVSSIVKTCTARNALPEPARVFQLALMQKHLLLSEAGPAGSLSETRRSFSTPLSEAGPAAGFSWKFTSAFWVKTR